MRTFRDLNPVVLFVYFLCVSGIAVFSMNPVLLAFSLAGALLLTGAGGRRLSKISLFYPLLFLILALLNPLIHHGGVTVLFVMNDNPVTLEALLYGIASGVMVVSVLFWFSTFSLWMTGDRLMYLFGLLSPKTALILSMALRAIPRLQTQTRRIEASQTALGLYRDDNLIDRVRAKGRILSTLITWMLENGITTADSMSARGYGTGRRTSFSLIRFRRTDGILLVLILSLTAAVAVGLIRGDLAFDYYPALAGDLLTPRSAVFYICYGTLSLLPSCYHAFKEIRWNISLSKI